MTKTVITSLMAGVLIFTLISNVPLSNAQPLGSIIPNSYIVILNDDVEDPRNVANEMAHKHGLSISHVYKNTINGYSAIIHPSQLSKVSSDSRVQYVEPDRVATINAKPPWAGGGDKDKEPVTQPPQEIPTGIERIFGVGVGLGDLSQIKVAVIDTGIDTKHPDLNVIDGVNCGKGNPNKFSDDNGHGTHVAGTIGAIDNDIGVIGVAPNVPLYSVKVLDRNGSGSYSDVICGVDWAAANGMDVANMSLGGGKSQALNDAVSSAINDYGVVFAVAAGNDDYEDACNLSPASTKDAITVSALDDRNGEVSGTTSNNLDPLASFSNVGSCIDIIAPGVYIYSTWKDGGYNTISGTSMATPHVAGAAAVYLSNNPNTSPLDVATALTLNGNYDWDKDSDPDNIQEPLLDLTFIP